ncbi:hypothetical protein [Leisingera caerulea]|uniref:hypothetical protein n=1 Tax=Leisingera caerulea TaxID=506591 RepID=UPI000402C930|nr:hypothetical protein [Leisingera caerulea]
MKLRDYIGAISRAAAEKGQRNGFRRVLTGAARLARSNPAELLGNIKGIARLSEIHDQELESWADPDEVCSGDGRSRFDVCDLRIWLRLAEAAGVAAIPAQEVARLEEEELELLLGSVQLPKGIRKSLAEGLAAGLDTAEGNAGRKDLSAFFEQVLDLKNEDQASAGRKADTARAAFEKMESALDEVPSSWMVRTQYAGSGNLKALVGTGLMLKADDTAQVRPGFEIGGGWVRTGNRRIIDFSDPRFLQTAIGGHKPGVSYLARPWAQPARYHEGEDLHRANTPLAGPGKWPAEWRVFVRGGLVSGVANYYGWTGEGATAANAWNAIRSAALAQRIVDHAEQLGLSAHFMDQVFIRKTGEDTEAIEMLDAEWPEDRMNCTLDFLETKEGIQFLEGGPAHMPGGGGHPCAFAGQGTTGHPMRSVARCEGVAYQCMPHVNLGDPATWVDGEADGCIDDWAAAARLAAEFKEVDPEMQGFLARVGVAPEWSCSAAPEV